MTTHLVFLVVVAVLGAGGLAFAFYQVGQCEQAARRLSASIDALAVIREDAPR